MSTTNEERKCGVYVKLVSPSNFAPVVQGFLRVGLPERNCKDFIESIQRVGHFGCSAGQIFLYNSDGDFTTVVGSNVVKNSIAHLSIIPYDA